MSRRKMNKQELQDLVAVLKEAKKYLCNYPIRRGTGPLASVNYICFAVDRAHVAGDYHIVSVYAIKEIIQRGINRRVYFDQWFRKHNPEVYRRLRHGEIQKYRHKWLDQLIRDYSKMAKEAVA